MQSLPNSINNQNLHLTVNVINMTLPDDVIWNRVNGKTSSLTLLACSILIVGITLHCIVFFIVLQLHP